MFCILSEPQEPLYEPHVQLHLSGLSGTPVSHMSHYVSHVKIYPVLDFFVSTISWSYVNGMYIQPCNVSCVPSESWGNHISKSCTSSHSGPSSSSVSHGSHYMNHVKIYPFSTVLCPQWALGATSYECHMHLAARCTMCPHWAAGATRLQHPLHSAISDVLVRCEPWEPLYEPRQDLSIFRRFMSPMSPGSHFI